MLSREIAVDTAVGCPTCRGAGTAAGAQLTQCPMCRGRGEVQNVQRTFLGQVMTARACPQCQGYGTLNPSPCPECAGDGRVRTRQNLRSRSRRGSKPAPDYCCPDRAKWARGAARR